MRRHQLDGSAMARGYVELCEKLGVPALAAFVDGLSSGARTLRLSSVDSDSQVDAIASVLPRVEGLEELDVSGMKLAVAKCERLKVLSVKGCSLGDLGCEEVQQRLACTLGACCVEVLDASQNRLSDAFITAFSATALACGGRLTVLDLSENCISDEGAVVLARALVGQGGAHLSQLDLGFNTLADRAAAALAALLPSTPLFALELEGNAISNAGAATLASALRGSTSLQRLNLNGNRLSGGSALARLSEALRGTPAPLQELALAGIAGGNGAEAGAAAVLHAACGSRHLQLLDLRGLPLHGEALDAVCRLLASPTTPLLTLRFDVASREGAEAVAQALPHNARLLHLMLGGPVPEHVLSFIAARVSANTLSHLQHEANSTFVKSSQRPPALLPARPASANAFNSKRQTPSEPVASAVATASRSPPLRPASAGVLGSGGGAAVPQRRIVRSTTQQARQLSSLDMTGLAGLAGGGAANKAAEVFRRHDADASGFLDAEEMLAALQDLGMLEGLKARQLGKFLSNAMREADVDRDGRIGLDDFVRFYDRLARFYSESARQGRIWARCRPPTAPLDASGDAQLRRVFKAYCRLRVGRGRQPGSSVQHLNCAQFMLLTRDAGLLEPVGPLSQCAADIIFTRARSLGSRRLSFKDFLTALAALADEAGVSFRALADALQGAAACAGSDDGAPASSSMPPCRAPSPAGPAPLVQAPGGLLISDLLDTRVGPLLPGRAGGGPGGGGEGGGRPPMPTLSGLPPATADGGGSPGTAALLVRRRCGAANTAASTQAEATTASRRLEQQLNPLFDCQDGDDGDVSCRAVQRSAAADFPGKGDTSPLGKYQGTQPLSGGMPTSSCIPADRGDVLSRLSRLEATLGEQQQQLALVTAQQESLAKAVMGLVDKLAADSGAHDGVQRAEVQELAQQVTALSLDVAQLGPVYMQQAACTTCADVDAKLSALTRRTEDRASRCESAIYQVARQVDVLDGKLRDEQETSLKALEAILAQAGNSPLRAA